MVDQTPLSLADAEVSTGALADQVLGLTRALRSTPDGRVSQATAEALKAVNQRLDALAARLRVRHVGPEVGMADMRAQSVYRIVVDAHRTSVGEPQWSVWVCDATPHANLRATWPLGGVARLRMRQVIEALPTLIEGWLAEVQSANQPVDTRARDELAAAAVALRGA